MKQELLTKPLPPGKAKSQIDRSLNPRVKHGGALSYQRRKTARPFHAGVAMHIVMHSTRAKGAWSLFHRKNRSKVLQMAYAYARRFKVEIHQIKNHGDHIQILIESPTRKGLADFFRVFAGRLAVVVTGAKKGMKKIGRFWRFLYWSKMVNWGKDFSQAREICHSALEFPKYEKILSRVCNRIKNSTKENEPTGDPPQDLTWIYNLGHGIA